MRFATDFTSSKERDNKGINFKPELKKTNDSKDSTNSINSTNFGNRPAHSTRTLKTQANESMEQQRKPARRNMSLIARDQNSRFTDHSLMTSKCINNSSVSKKVPYNINQNSLRKQILHDLELSLNLILLSGQSVSSIDAESEIKYDVKREGYLIGSCLLTFNLKENSGTDNFYLDFCGDQIFELSVNGLTIPVESVSWVNNQINLNGLRGGSSL